MTPPTERQGYLSGVFSIFSPHHDSKKNREACCGFPVWNDQKVLRLDHEADRQVTRAQRRMHMRHMCITVIIMLAEVRVMKPDSFQKFYDALSINDRPVFVNFQNSQKRRGRVG